MGVASASPCPWLSDGEVLCRVSVQWLVVGIFGVSSGQDGCGAEVEQSLGQMWGSSLKGSKEGGCGENLRKPLR